MILIADSGSSKTDWRVIHKDGQISQFRGIGFNPYYLSVEEMTQQLKQEFLLNIAEEIEEIYYYGAGCAAPEKKVEVQQSLRAIFSKAKIQIDHDLLAAAKATCGHHPGIACILGTGSNSCDYDGKNIISSRPAAGYILGDEGSGSYFGKQLLSNFLYHKLPAHVEADFIATYKLDKDQIVNHVYREPNANVYIASFMPFIAKHKDEPFFSEMVYAGFKKFMEVHVCCYENFQNTEVHFVGSLSKIFEAELDKAARELNVTVTSIIQKPITGLVNYHLNYILNRQTVKSC